MDNYGIINCMNCINFLSSTKRLRVGGFTLCLMSCSVSLPHGAMGKIALQCVIVEFSGHTTAIISQAQNMFLSITLVN